MTVWAIFWPTASRPSARAWTRPSQSLRYRYKVCGRLLSASSYATPFDPANPTSGTPLNQVLFQYDSNGLLDAEYQEHGGAVNTATSVYVGYGYDDSTAVVGGVTTSVTGFRPTTLQYPTTGSNSSRVLTYSYGTAGGENDAINRLDSIVDGYGTANSVTTSDTLAGESYLGLDTIVTEQYEQPQIELDYAGSTAGQLPRPRPVQSRGR